MSGSRLPVAALLLINVCQGCPAPLLNLAPALPLVLQVLCARPQLLVSTLSCLAQCSIVEIGPVDVHLQHECLYARAHDEADRHNLAHQLSHAHPKWRIVSCPGARRAPKGCSTLVTGDARLNPCFMYMLMYYNLYLNYNNNNNNIGNNKYLLRIPYSLNLTTIKNHKLISPIATVSF